MNGLNLYKVFVEKVEYAEFFVYGDTEEAAQEDAEELAAELQANEWDTSDWDVNVQKVNWTARPKTGLLWSGGPDGEDLNAS